MAIISKIRNQSGLLIGAVGISMLLFIVGGDFLSSSPRLLGGASNDDLGNISGEPVSQLEYSKRVQAQLDQLDPSQINENTRTQVREQVWQEILLERVMMPEYRELGIIITPEELANAFVGQTPHPIVVQYFTDPNTRQVIQDFQNPQTGQLDPAAVRRLMDQILADPSSDGYRSWVRLEQAVKKTLLDDKYKNIVSKGFFINDLEAKNSYINREKRANVQYVYYQYNTIADSTIEVSDSEIRSYYNKHKNDPKFQKDRASRSIEYLEFEVKPSAADVDFGMEQLNKLKAEFETETDDTAFVQFQSDNPSIKYHSVNNLPPGFDSTLFTMDVGTVHGPYQESRATEEYTYKLAKIMWDTLTADSISVRHILLPAQKTDSIGYANAQTQSDSLMAVIASNDNFGEMAAQYSQDPGSKDKGGLYEVDYAGVLNFVPEFKKATLENKVGEVALIETQFGFHLIEVTKRGDPVRIARIGFVDRTIEPSGDTKDEVFDAANSFSFKSGEAEHFESPDANTRPVQIGANLTETATYVGGLSNARTLVQWAYEAELGAVSAPIKIGNKYIVGHLTSIAEKGMQPMENVTEEIREEVIKEKKAEIMKSKLQEKGDLIGMSQVAQVEIQTANDVAFESSTLEGVPGRELAVIGSIFNLPQGQLSAPIVGNSGVFVVQVQSVTEADNGFNITDLRTDLQGAQGGQVNFRVKPALEKLADVEDNRYKFY